MLGAENGVLEMRVTKLKSDVADSRMENEALMRPCGNRTGKRVAVDCNNISTACCPLDVIHVCLGAGFHVISKCASEIWQDINPILFVSPP